MERETEIYLTGGNLAEDVKNATVIFNSIEHNEGNAALNTYKSGSKLLELPPSPERLTLRNNQSCQKHCQGECEVAE